MSLTDTIRAVQKKLGTTPDGQPGPETWAAIHLAVVGKKPAADAGLDAIIRAVQKKLGAFVDGNPGPETWGAIHLAVVGKKAPDIIKNKPTEEIVGDGKPADSRSETNIATLHPRVRPFARALIEKSAGQGITIKVISAMRTYAEQDELFAQGRTKPGKIVTKAKGGFSNHNFGIAFDIGVFEGTYIPESPKYKVAGALGADLGLEWGGNWKTIEDQPHFQLRPDWAADISEPEMLAELRRRKDSGKDFYAQ
ncbi:MAG: peptidoglycan LD-endopeptidase CwlK [Verrucomicrobiota bacterium]|jgi:peptidoglycan L-alanyl-D-glutamate endopeptidase CwlK